MNLKLDENLPISLVGILAAMGHNADTIPQEGLAGRPDQDVFEAAQREARFLVTQDLDFSDARRFAPGSHQGLLIVRLSNPSRTQLLERVRRIFETENVESWLHCLIVATERKVRIRRPPKG